MLKSTRKHIEDKMFDKLEIDFPELTQHQIRKISLSMAEIAIDMIVESNSKTTESLNKVILDLEQHRKKFRDNIEMLQKHTKSMIAKFQKDALISFKNNPKTNKAEMVGRSSVITDMVKFINELNDSVLDFYENVYEIKEDRDTQINLFS